jgi:hypothetical protein
MDIRATLKRVHEFFNKEDVDHLLIGGMALACYGSQRSTVDLDFLIREEQKEKAKSVLLANDFTLGFESPEVLQFGGAGFVDLLIARRPITQSMFDRAQNDGLEGLSFVKAEDLIGLKVQAYSNDSSRSLQDKADIQYLIESQDDLDWQVIKEYADLFDEWSTIEAIKKNLNL